MSSSIIALTTPEASVPGMSQCSQPWVWEIMATELPVPPTTKPASSNALIRGSTFSHLFTMTSTLLRMVKRIWPSPQGIDDVADLAQGEQSRMRWVPTLHGPDLVAALGHVMQHAGTRTVVVLPVAEVLLHQRMQVLEAVRAPALDGRAVLRLAPFFTSKDSPNLVTGRAGKPGRAPRSS